MSSKQARAVRHSTGNLMVELVEGLALLAFCFGEALLFIGKCSRASAANFFFKRRRMVAWAERGKPESSRASSERSARSRPPALLISEQAQRKRSTAPVSAVFCHCFHRTPRIRPMQKSVRITMLSSRLKAHHVQGHRRRRWLG